MSIRLHTHAVLPVSPRPETVVASDAELPAGMRPPSVGLVCLYGINSTNEVMRRLRMNFRSKGSVLRTIEIAVDGGPQKPGRLGLEPEFDDKGVKKTESIFTARFVHLNRLTLEAEREVVSRLASVASANGETFKNPYERRDFLTRQPHLLAEAFRSTDFEAEIVAFDIHDSESVYKRRSVALLLSGEHIIRADNDAPVVRGEPDMEVLFPAKLPATAEEFRGAKSKIVSITSKARRRAA